MEEKTRVKKKSARVFFSKNTCVFWGASRKPSTKAFAHLVQGSSIQCLKLNKRTYPLNLKHRTFNSLTT
ncbi:hypothetical protein D1003_08490 [Riemerella anatipestifer]|nr:hypothetical protein [Riemerella anatipestifer]